jgi:hypothetical protein
MVTITGDEEFRDAILHSRPARHLYLVTHYQTL